jgi:hypothetical protein
MLSETCPAGGWARRAFPESPNAARLAGSSAMKHQFTVNAIV